MSRDIVPFDRPALATRLLAAFRQAEKDGRVDVADCVLAAIELAGRELIQGREVTSGLRPGGFGPARRSA